MFSAEGSDGNLKILEYSALVGQILYLISYKFDRMSDQLHAPKALLWMRWGWNSTDWVSDSALLDSVEKKKKLLLEPGIKPRYHIRPICRPVTIPKGLCRLHSQTKFGKLTPIAANHTGVLVDIIAKSCFFRSNPHRTIDLFSFQEPFLHLRLLIFCSIASPKRWEATFLRASQNPYLHTIEAIHYGCYRIRSRLYLYRRYRTWCNRAPPCHSLMNNETEMSFDKATLWKVFPLAKPYSNLAFFAKSVCRCKFCHAT
jgi:hypothetical protein